MTGERREPLLHPDLDNIPYSCDYRTSFDLVSAALWSSRGLLVDASPGGATSFTASRRSDSTAPALHQSPRTATSWIASESLATGTSPSWRTWIPPVLSLQEPVAALLLLRDTGLCSGRRPQPPVETLATLLARTRPRHVSSRATPRREAAGRELIPRQPRERPSDSARQRWPSRTFSCLATAAPSRSTTCQTIARPQGPRP